MRFDTPDPAYTGSPRSRANFRIATRLVLAFVGFLWLVQLLNWGTGPDWGPFALRPRDWAGAAGIVFAPLLHSDFGHLLANTLPLVLLGITALHLYPRSTLRALPFLYLGPGVAVWLFGRDGLHVGASGIVYGRNIIQHPSPAGITAALMGVLHDGLGVDAALKLVTEYSK